MIVLLLILVALGAIYYFSFNYTYNSAKEKIISQQIETSKNQAETISRLLEEKLKSGYLPNEIKEELQRSIENSSTENSFICMFANNGEEVCHPDVSKIGTLLDDNNSNIRSISNQKVIYNFKKAIQEKKAIGGIRKLVNYTEVVYLSPVGDTEWVVASHLNIVRLNSIFDELSEKLGLIFLMIWISSSLIIYFFLDYFNTRNLKEITHSNRQMGEHFFNEIKTLKENSVSTELPKQRRLLADKGTRLYPVYVDNIAHVYTQDKITYITELNSERSTINLSLEELYNSFDKEMFYRVSRQVIVSAKAIDKIEKYGNTQLKVQTKPPCSIDVIVSKSKIADFKEWLGKN